MSAKSKNDTFSTNGRKFRDNGCEHTFFANCSITENANEKKLSFSRVNIAKQANKKLYSLAEFQILERSRILKKLVKTFM